MRMNVKFLNFRRLSLANNPENLKEESIKEIFGDVKKKRIIIYRQKYYRKIFCVKEILDRSKSSLQSGTIDLIIYLFHFMLCHFKFLSSFIFLFQVNERLCIA